VFKDEILFFTFISMHSVTLRLSYPINDEVTTKLTLKNHNSIPKGFVPRASVARREELQVILQTQE